MTEKGLEFDSCNYMEKPLSATDLRELLHRAALRPQDAVRTNEAVYREHVAGKNLSDEQLIQIIAKHPELLQRPIAVREGKAVLARPLENLSKLGIK